MRSDPFALASLRATLLVAATLAAIPDGAVAAIRAHELYGEPVLRRVEMSPSGELLALLMRRRGWDQVVLRRRNDPAEFIVFERLSMLRGFYWIDDGHLALSMGADRHRSHRILRVSAEGDELHATVARIPLSGWIVQLMPERRGELLWSIPGARSRVYRGHVSDLLAMSRKEPSDSDQIVEVASLEEHVDVWIGDRHGEIRAALVVQGSSQARLWYRASRNQDWKLVLESDDVEHFPYPLAVAENDRDLIVSTSVEGQPRALVEFDSSSGQLGEEIFSHPDADVTGVVFDETGGRVIGAVFERDGLEVTEHFDSQNDRRQRSLEAIFPNRAVTLLGGSRNQRHVIVLARGPRHPGTFYVLDTQRNEAREIGRVMPWLDPEELADVVPIRVPASDDLEIQAFIARPNGVEKPALVVLPHGGPWAVRDTRLFDPWVQYIAAGGLAVLQVNYRGSSGRGAAFLDAGKRQWGQGIEDDIEAAIDQVIGLGWADGERICIAGASYGGYSALISAIRNPDRFRCAVSLNGPTDLPFLYHSSPYLKHTEAGREYFREYVGDPEEGVEALKAISPVYRARELTVPVLLVQGGLDRRVDVEHYHRLKVMLEALGRQPEGYVIRKGHHGLSGVQWVEFVGRMRRFLLRHLGTAREP